MGEKRRNFGRHVANDANKGRCGRKFGGRICDCSGSEIYCNTVTGLCGNTVAHKYAQRGEQYDCKDEAKVGLADKGRCGRKFGGRICDCSGNEIYCNTFTGLCGNTVAHKYAQRGEQYDCKEKTAPVS